MQWRSPRRMGGYLEHKVSLLAPSLTCKADMSRWNPALFAEKGYFVVAVNPTGSTGYGQDFTDRIQSEWGGRTFASSTIFLEAPS